MDAVFLRILREHVRRYPMMEPQDFGKLAFQSEFGAEHLAAERQTVLDSVLEEQRLLSDKSSPQAIEDIGGGLCRFPLAALRTEEEAGLLADLFVRTAEKSRGTAEGLSEKIKQAAGFGTPGMQEWLAAWEKSGCPPVHHSKTYRWIYDPHYRLLQKDFAAYFPALAKIGSLLASGNPIIIGIDGRCGSGKSHLAELAGSLFSGLVIHMDDFYLPVRQRKENWEKIPGGNMDFERLYKEILTPLRDKETALYRPYDCGQDRLGWAVPLPPCRLTVVEGSYSHHPKLPVKYDLKIFLTCGKKERENRLREREGNGYPMFEQRWIPMEEHYLQTCAIEADSDLQIDTTGILT